MYLIIEDQFVHVSDIEAEAKSAELVSLYSDKIDDDTYFMYYWDRTSFYIDEQGKFVKTRDEEEQKSRWLNQRYVPDLAVSIKRQVQYVLKGDTVSNDYKLATAGLYESWKFGNYTVGDIRNYNGQTWECIQAHDNAIYPDIKPDNTQTWHTFWRPLHGKSAETARPWVKPQYGTTDMYHAGEYMIWTDNKIYKCLSDTVYSPEEYAQAWAEHKNNWETQE